MFSYESGSPKKPGDSSGISMELSSREIRRWNENDFDLIKEVERQTLIDGLKGGKSEYFIKGAGDHILDHGSIRSLQEKYPDVTVDSPF